MNQTQSGSATIGTTIMAPIPISRVLDARRASTFGFADVKSDIRERVEFYSGIINIGFRGGGGSVHRKDFESFLPISFTNQILSYEDGTEIDTTVMCAPCAVAGDDDEANVAAVDTAEVVLEPQTFPGIGGNPLCLVLRFKAAALNTTIHTVVYHVTVIHRLREGSETGDGEILKIGEDQGPA